MFKRALLAFAFLVPFTLAPTAAIHAAPSQAPNSATQLFRYFPETGHHISSQIKTFYETHGGIDIFGLPLTEVFQEDGMQVQYFERARFELHPELAPEFYVSLTRLGSHYTEGRTEAPFQWLSAAPSADRALFVESGHSIGGAFRGFWEGRGGLAAFGFPISEEFTETNPLDGQPYMVQYFERARFEYHPEHAGTAYEVQLSQLGRQLIGERPSAQAKMPAVAQMSLLGKATTVFKTSAAEREFNIARATQMFNNIVVQPGQEFSFLKAGDFSDNAGFVEGYGIVNGRLEKVVGGGLCQVSTTMFRAVSNAGLEVTRRQGHSFVVYFYENILGFDATVFSPSVDFRWRNDSSSPILMVANSDPVAATVTFEMWGVSDGRKTTYEGPYTKNVVQPGKATWQYDAKLAPNAKTQLVHGRAGMDVSYIRTVTMPNGKVKHYDNYQTHYDPWNDFWSYGSKVKPPAGVRVLDSRN